MSSSLPRSEWLWQHGTGLLLALLTAKLVILASIGLSLTLPVFPALFGQDIATAIVVTLAVGAVRPRIAASAIWAVAIVYVALSVPITAVLGSPLTWTMIQAAGGALSDSIRHHVTLHNVATIGVVGAAGFWGSRLAGALPRRLRMAACACLVVVSGMGLWSASRTNTIGLDRNALTALVPRGRIVSAAAMAVESRRTPYPAAGGASFDLASYRGAARGMNVALIVLESTAAQYLRIYGAADDPMPTVTALSEHALIYDRAYAAYPESVKGLYATLCGRMPLMGVPAEQHAALPCASIAGAFGEAGYRTALFHSGRFGYLGMAALLQDKGFGLLEDAGAIGGHVESSFGVDESSTVNRVLRWIDASDSSAPFFAAYLPAAGHHPYATNIPGPFRGDTDFARYQNALHEADTAVAQLLDGLRKRGLDRNTAVMIVGDHGEAFGQHPANNGHTLFIYDENVHVPWLISVPGRTTGRHVSTVASLVDVPSTLRDLSGLPSNLLDQGLGLTVADQMALFFTDYSLALAGLRDGCWTYIYEADADRSQMFDVCHDPGQATDRIHDRDNDDRAVTYRRRLETAMFGQSGNMVRQR